MGRGGLLMGAAYGYNRFQPLVNDMEEGAEHLGSIVTHQTNLFGLIGINSRINLVASLPIVRWAQVADIQNAHHRTATVTGFRDVKIGVRYIVSNLTFGPGSRIFLGLSTSLPTASSYSSNPFVANADSVNHDHFTFGSGTMQVAFTGEWWHRSEFPWVLGLTGQLSPRWLTSDMGFQPGYRAGLDLHAIGQSYRLWRGFPYLTLRFRWEGSDYWESDPAPNSGGFFLDGSAGLQFELFERLSAVARFHMPLVVAADGAQQAPAGLDLSFRLIRP